MCNFIVFQSSVIIESIIEPFWFCSYNKYIYVNKTKQKKNQSIDNTIELQFGNEIFF